MLIIQKNKESINANRTMNAAEEYRSVPVSELRESPTNPRKLFEELRRPAPFERKRTERNWLRCSSKTCLSAPPPKEANKKGIIFSYLPYPYIR
jgi:hypothetical protein